ncbi:CdaR family protein [Aurantibacter aestuarii]|nr:CdaR family protein [Aurantibacter aestuarii]
MIKLIRFIKSILKTKRLNAFFLFFIMAFFILILVKLSSNYTNVLQFEIDFQDIPDDIVIENKEEIYLLVKFEASGFFWMRYVFKNPSVKLSLTDDFSVSEDYYQINEDKAFAAIKEQLSTRIKDFKLVNQNLKIFFDTYFVRKVPIKAITEISFENGFGALKPYSLSVDSVKVIGPKNIIDTITSLSNKVAKFDNINSSISKVFQLNLDNYPNTIKVVPEQLSINVKGERFTEGELDISVELINVPSNLSINYFPKTIKVTYTVPLNDFKSITTSDFKIIADYKKTNTLNNFLFPELRVINPKIKDARMKQTKLEYIITK